MTDTVWVLQGGDGYECGWMLGIYATEDRALEAIAEFFSDFEPWFERTGSNCIYRPRFKNGDEDESWVVRHERILAELEEPDIRQGVNYVTWHEAEVVQ